MHVYWLLWEELPAKHIASLVYQLPLDNAIGSAMFFTCWSCSADRAQELQRREAAVAAAAEEQCASSLKLNVQKQELAAALARLEEERKVRCENTCFCMQCL
jgi:hypothetical protein